MPGESKEVCVVAGNVERDQEDVAKLQDVYATVQSSNGAVATVNTAGASMERSSSRPV